MTKNLSVCCIECHKETKTPGLANHYNRIHGNDEELKKRAMFSNLMSAERSRTKATEKALKECKQYSLNPRLCKCCNSEIDFFRRRNKCCSASCSTTLANIAAGRQTEETKTKISNKLKGKPNKLKGLPGTTKKYCCVFFYKCSQCDNIILSKSTKPTRKTCSKECQVHASTGHRTYINGKRKNIYYQTISGETVLLESSWELEIAQFLDENKFQWIRPKYIKWVDSSGKQRNYYPDFYLPEHDLYLDPKNPYAMKQDLEKMTAIASKVNIIYGNKDIIKNQLIKIAGQSTR
jgi:hypothetical protein